MINNVDPPVAGPFGGNDSQTVFPFGFKVFATSDLEVVALLSGVSTLLVLDSDYSVSLNADQDATPGGSITYPLAGPPLTAGDTLTGASKLAYTQPTSLQNAGGYFAKVVENAIDRTVMLIKQASADLSRALHLPLSDAGVNTEMPDAATRRGTIIGFTDDDAATPTLIVPADQSAASLGLLLAGSDGAANIGFTPVSGIASSDVQAAIGETDLEWRTAVSTTNGAATALTARVAALEATATTGWIGKATLAALNADLAHVAGVVALVTNDGANDGYYLKLGASGAGSWQASDMTPWSIDTQAMAVLAKQMDNALAVFGDAVIAMKIATDRWIVRTPVSGGEVHDYCEYEMFDMGAYMGITHAFGLHSIRAQIGGVIDHFMEQSPTAGNVSTNEFAIKAGHIADPFDDAHYALYGIGHGHLNYTGLTIQMDGGANQRDVAVGTTLTGTLFTFNSAYQAKLLDGTVIGTVAVAHLFDTNGLRISHQHVITTANIGQQNSYSGMLAATGVNRIKPVGVAETVIGAQDGSQINFGQYTTFAMYYASRPTHLLELSLPTGAPGNPPNDWSYDTTTKTFLLDNANGIRKLYVNWSSGAAARAYPVGTYSFLTKYQARLGAAT